MFISEFVAMIFFLRFPYQLHLRSHYNLITSILMRKTHWLPLGMIVLLNLTWWRFRFFWVVSLFGILLWHLMISSTMRSSVVSARKSRATVASAPTFRSSERAARRKEVAVDLCFCLGLLKLLIKFYHLMGFDLIVPPLLVPSKWHEKQNNNRKVNTGSP